MNFKLKDVVLDYNETFGKSFALADVIEKNVYQDGRRTDEKSYTYEIVCIDNRMKTIEVKIPGKQRMIAPKKGEYVNVALVDFNAEPYILDGKFGLKITASDIKEIKG